MMSFNNFQDIPDDPDFPKVSELIFPNQPSVESKENLKKLENLVIGYCSMFYKELLHITSKLIEMNRNISEIKEKITLLEKAISPGKDESSVKSGISNPLTKK